MPGSSLQSERQNNIGHTSDKARRAEDDWLLFIKSAFKTGWNWVNVLPVGVFPALPFFATKKQNTALFRPEHPLSWGKTYFAVINTAGKGMCQVCLSRRANEPLQSDVYLENHLLLSDHRMSYRLYSQWLVRARRLEWSKHLTCCRVGFGRTGAWNWGLFIRSFLHPQV